MPASDSTDLFELCERITSQFLPDELNDFKNAFSGPVNCVVGGFEEVRIQMLKLGHSHSSGGKA
jgi:hypothetical protein